jgi:hypothetical protein
VASIEVGEAASYLGALHCPHRDQIFELTR